MDADLQDDILVVREFVKKYKEGYDVVYGVREDRSSDTKFKRWTAELFYKFQAFMGIENISNMQIIDYSEKSPRSISQV